MTCADAGDCWAHTDLEAVDLVADLIGNRAAAEWIVHALGITNMDTWCVRHNQWVQHPAPCNDDCATVAYYRLCGIEKRRDARLEDTTS